MKIETELNLIQQEKRKPQKKIICLTGTSGSGKTTLAEQLIACFQSMQLIVSTIKHAHCGFDIDRPGKDSFRMRTAGAQEVFLIGDERWVLMREYAGALEPPLEEAVARLAPCDLVLVEGFKTSAAPKIEVYRPSLSRPPLWTHEPTIIAVASDEPYKCPLPVLPLNEPATIARFIRTHLMI
jgi:molybdopterin-guanine dinucleotide biosynthesis protein B